MVRTDLHIWLGARLRLGFTLLAGLLVGLPVRLLTVFVAVTDRLATSTVEERHVHGTARSAESNFGHF